MRKIISVVILKSENQTSVRFNRLTTMGRYYPNQKSIDRLLNVLAHTSVHGVRPQVSVYTDVIILKYEL